MKRAFALVVLSALVVGAARADIGPKPTIDIRFAFDRPGVAIRSGTLYECQDQRCKNSGPLRTLGPQRFTCMPAECGGSAYGFADHLWVQVVLSDGRKLSSRPFAKTTFDATFKAKVRGRALTIAPATP